jgi:hypothetical protein
VAPNPWCEAARHELDIKLKVKVNEKIPLGNKIENTIQ